MGLDMYLYKKTYVQNWEHHAPEQKHIVTVKKNGKTRKDIKPDRVTYVVEQVGYWRKFNALHSWFVQNCADGEDDCKEVNVNEEQLVELLGILKKVKSLLDKSKTVIKQLETYGGEKYDHEVYECEDEVKELLSPRQGFFFGSYDIDKWYKSDVENTIVLLEELMNENEESKKHGIHSGEFSYQASW
jgi:hypothetical protein